MTANNQTYYQDRTPTATPILTPENGAVTSRVMNQVLKQQMYLWTMKERGEKKAKRREGYIQIKQGEKNLES